MSTKYVADSVFNHREPIITELYRNENCSII